MCETERDSLNGQDCDMFAIKRGTKQEDPFVQVTLQDGTPNGTER